MVPIAAKRPRKTTSAKRCCYCFVACTIASLLFVTLQVVIHQPTPTPSAVFDMSNPNQKTGSTTEVSKQQQQPSFMYPPQDIQQLISSNELPPWMRQYFTWHASQRTQCMQPPTNNDQQSWQKCKYLLLQCLPGSKKCGGTADRLKPLPLMLWVAHTSQRILLIKWGRPAELEEFLLPPQGGMDWRVPDWLWENAEFRQGPRATNVEEMVEYCNKPTTEYAMVKARVQSHDHGSIYYNQQQQQQSTTTTFEAVYHAMWPILFTPAPPVAQLIERQLLDSKLVPGHYVGIHIRALYAVSERDPAMVQHWTRNAVNCASQLQPQSAPGYYYLSSDSSWALTVGVQYGTEQQVRVVTRSSVQQESGAGDSSHLQQPLHLDKAPKTAKAEDFYDTFVDLYLLAMSRCVTYNMGGFGTWAALISPSSCSFQHHNASGIHKCEWMDHAPGGGDEWNPPKSLFLPPMAWSKKEGSSDSLLFQVPRAVRLKPGT